MTYGCEVWGDTALGTIRLKRLLLKTQRKIVILVNKAYRTISYEANLVTARVNPIDLLIREEINIKQDIEAGEERTESKRTRRRETLNEWQRLSLIHI